MKKLLIILMSFLCLILTSCSNNKYTLEDIKGKTYEEALEILSLHVNVTKELVNTAEYYPNTVIDYKDKKAGDKVKEKSIVTLLVSDIPLESQTFENSIVSYSKIITKFTGPDSINEEVMFEAGLAGCDLGISIELGDEIIYLFGDSFSGEKRTGLWYSNFIARSTDRNFYDGATFDSIVSRKNGMAKPFAQGAHQENHEENNGTEVTKIPTGGIKIGDSVYIFYMSVRYWGPNASWLVNYNQCVKSQDLDTWEDVPSLRWGEDEAPNFGQIYPFKDPKSNYIYLYSIPGGRHGGLVVSRVNINSFEVRDEYEYLVGENNWVKGDEGLKALLDNPYYINGPKVSEMSVTYNSYLNKYTLIYSMGGEVLMYESSTPYDQFTNPVVLFAGPYYGAVTSEALMEDNGKTIYIPLSYWTDYNTYWLQIRFY